jgi:hypothetical protein
VSDTLQVIAQAALMAFALGMFFQALRRADLAESEEKFATEQYNIVRAEIWLAAGIVMVFVMVAT